ncbi:hypothetical protein VTO42DRAFT_8499 [Malbranchea cinnamomea]
MAANKETMSFNDIIQAARQRRRQQALADKIFSKNRGLTASDSRIQTKSELPAGGSLASRVERRSASSGVKKPGSAAATSSRMKPANNRRNRENRILAKQVPSEYQSDAVVQDETTEFSIKGRASGPTVVIGSNFAPGTSAADIQSAFEPVGGTMLDCRILSTYPSVVAEMTFVESRGAEAVVAAFDNRKADGRILHLRIKQAPLGGIPTGSATSVLSPRGSAFDLMRELADRERQRSRRAEPQIQDGRYGFSENGQHDDYGNGSRNETGLYSDKMMVDEPARGSRGGSRVHR